MPEQPALRDLQHQLLDALRLGDVGALDLIAEQAPLSSEARLSIYASAYRIRLREALENDHEMLGYYLGDDQFEVMADAYIDVHPSRVRSLRQFGDHLPAFLASTEPYSGLPLLAELAGFERLMLDVFDAPDASYADLAALQALPPEQWPDMRLRLHPSLRLHVTHTNAVQVWQALKAGQEPPAADGAGGYWLLWRGSDRLSQFQSIKPDERALLLAAMEGASFAELCEHLLAELPEHEVGQAMLDYLVGWLQMELVSLVDVRQAP